MPPLEAELDALEEGVGEGLVEQAFVDGAGGGGGTRFSLFRFTNRGRTGFVDHL